MAAPSVTHILTNGTAADATQINTNFNDIINGFSDGTKDFIMASGDLSGNLVVDGNTTLGDASGDTLTVNATASFANNVTLGATADDDITMNGVVRENILMADGKGIDFSRLTDDSVAGTTTVKQILSDYELGAWTPYDDSGADLTLTVIYGHYIKIGELVWINMMVVYPQTVNGNMAMIGGLPYTPTNYCYLPMFLGAFPNQSTDGVTVVSPGYGRLELSRNNLNMSQLRVSITGSYLAFSSI